MIEEIYCGMGYYFLYVVLKEMLLGMLSFFIHIVSLQTQAQDVCNFLC